MIATLYPATQAELAEALGEAVVRNRRVQLAGNSSKSSMGGPIAPPDVFIGTAHLRGILDYEPDDLTISVRAGTPWRELTCKLAEHRQMIPLDPPFADTATVGGVIAANCAGPRQRLFGTARDLVIGMTFATAQGKLVQSGGMVVKNVAGLDMAKLMIGSFGTLSAIASVNFKLTPMPELERTFLLEFPMLAETIAARNAILKGVLQPSALDILNPAASAQIGYRNWLLVIRASGSDAAIERYRRDLTAIGAVETDITVWNSVEEFTPRFLAQHSDGAVARASCTLKGLETALASMDGPAVARAGSGTVYAYFTQAADAPTWAAIAVAQGHAAVVEFAPDHLRAGLDLWPSQGNPFETMRRIKRLFDPENLLNPGRLYGRI